MGIISTALGPERMANESDANVQSEWLLMVALRFFRVPVKRFAPIGALMCTGSTGNRAKKRHGSCTRPYDFDGEGIMLRYSQEASEAMSAARWLTRGWVWRAT